MIPVYLQQFKAAGIYRVVFDKSTILNVDSEILRLVVGFSEKGPFNIPVYITNVTEFKMYFGDISKKLEKRGIYFHRLALQALQAGPILCLNLKKFKNEAVGGSTISTTFNSKYEIIENVKLKVEDIYNTSRFWELDADKLNNLKSIDGQVMDQYINIATTNTKESSGTYFIRKASGNKVSQFNITVSDWYSDRQDEMPDFLEPYKNSLVSDFFAEIYVFGTKFTAAQVLSSSTLKKYFEVIINEDGAIVTDDNNEPVLRLVNHVTDAYGDWVDTLDELYKDPTSHAIGHYVGCLIPEFRDKQGNYASLDTVFNQEQSEHNMMMAFNVDMLYEDETAEIDLSGRLAIINENNTTETTVGNKLTLKNIFNGTATTNLLGNSASKVIANKITFYNNAVKFDENGELEPIIPFNNTQKKITGTLFVSSYSQGTNDGEYSITLQQIGPGKDGEAPDSVTIKIGNDEYAKAEFYKLAVRLGFGYEVLATSEGAEKIIQRDGITRYYKLYKSGYGTYYNPMEDANVSADQAATSTPFIEQDGDVKTFTFDGPQKVITAITRIDKTSDSIYDDSDRNLKASIMDVTISMINDEEDSVYGNSVSFIPVINTNWENGNINGSFALVTEDISDISLYSIVKVGDCFLAAHEETDINNTDVKVKYYDNVFVQEVGEERDEDGVITKYYIKFAGVGRDSDNPYTGEPEFYSNGDTTYLVRIDQALNQEIGTLSPQYLEGYTYESAKPASPTMYDKLQWQKFILSALTEYKGLRTGLLNKSDIDYRYIVDTFDSYVDSSLKSTLSYLAKQKESAFAILNFPAVKTFIKCPYTSFTNSEGVFDVNYIAKGYNKKKATYIKFSLPEDIEGASFCAFYTPLKFSDGYVDSIIPSAGLVSNLFIDKYTSRQPYYIIAGPTYGKITASNLIGPDYNYCKEELYVMEPFGVNCMVYRPNFGTFINSNQTAKQTPVSALSKVNIRELVIYLQDEIEKVLQQYQWDFNNQVTRNAILERANAICSRVQANGGIETFRNVMDESNNTPEIIENEMAILSTSIEPGFGCGKMVQELTLYRRGMLKASIQD